MVACTRRRHHHPEPGWVVWLRTASWCSMLALRVHARRIFRNDQCSKSGETRLPVGDEGENHGLAIRKGWSPNVCPELASQGSALGEHGCHQEHLTRHNRVTRSGARGVEHGPDGSGPQHSALQDQMVAAAASRSPPRLLGPISAICLAPRAWDDGPIFVTPV